MELAKSFDPHAIESHWYPFWESRGWFKAAFDPSRPSFSIQLPPPNVTGTLHMGHAFQQTLMDILTRWHRMKGENVLWQPGTDHAGIATQMVVERQLETGGHLAPRAGPREVRRARLGLEGAVGLDDHAPDAPPRRLVRLVARILHDGRGALARRHRGLRAPARGRPHLPRQAPRELGSGAAHRRLRPRGRVARGERLALAPALPARGRHRPRSSSPPRVPRRCWATPPWRCTRGPSATATSSASRCACRSPTGSSRSSPTSTSTGSSAPAA